MDTDTNDQTRPSLLIRVRDHEDAQAWEEFYELYAPLLYRYARAQGLNHTEAEEIRAQCCESLVRQIPTFEYDRSSGGFKAWLRTMVSRRVIDRLRKRKEHQVDSAVLRGLAGQDDSAEELWEEHWRREHLRYCVQAVRPQVSEETWNTFRMLVEEGLTVKDVCDRLEITPNQVYKARARMLELVRRKMAYLDPPA